MKILVISFVLLHFAFTAVFAENFYVIKVEGKILCDNVELKTGDKLSSESSIHFTETDDKIYLLSPSNGYFLLTSSEQKKSASGWIVELKNAVIPQNKYYKTATRGDNTSFDSFDDIYDLMAFFRDDVLIVEETEFSVNPDNIILNDMHFFEFECISGNDKIICDQGNNLFTISGKFDEASFKMSYVKNTEKLEIGTFKLHLLKRETLAKELNVFFLNQNINNSTSIYFEQIVPFISTVYGNTNLNVIREIISSDLQIPLMVKE